MHMQPTPCMLSLVITSRDEPLISTIRTPYNINLTPKLMHLLILLRPQVAPGRAADAIEPRSEPTLSLRTTAIALDDILSSDAHPRKTKIVCTMGPACWSEEGLGALLDAGMDVARFNFSHGDHAGHKEVSWECIVTNVAYASSLCGDGTRQNETRCIRQDESR